MYMKCIHMCIYTYIKYIYTVNMSPCVSKFKIIITITVGFGETWSNQTRSRQTVGDTRKWLWIQVTARAPCRSCPAV